MRKWFIICVIAFFFCGCSEEDTVAGNDDAGIGGEDIPQPSDVADVAEEDVADPLPDVEEGDVDLPPVLCQELSLCDDGDACTHGDACTVDGDCVGATYACDDDRVCTDNVCDGLGGCLYPIVADACLIGNICYTSGEGETCAFCDPSVSQVGWSNGQTDNVSGPLLIPCDDGNACTTEDACTGLQCFGFLITCEDGQECTQDGCDSETGCTFKPAFGFCDDSNACTEGDQCDEAGACVGMWDLSCDDGEDCTQDSCDVLTGCVFSPASNDCSDGDVCSVGDRCVEGLCLGGPVNACNDGNSCTDDACDADVGCLHVLNDNPCCTGATNFCDDGNPCSEDLCDPVSGACQYEDFLGGCDDGDSCTILDECSGGQCSGVAKACDDENPCTEDSCGLGGACIHLPVTDGLACDDAQECSVDDECVAGVCSGDETNCQCVPTFSDSVNKVVEMVIGADGTAGQAVDVDGNPGTCSPSGSCSDGLDNALSLIGAFANDSFAESLAGGTLIFLFEHAEDALLGNEYSLHFYVGEVGDPLCNVQTDICSYYVQSAFIDENCQAVVSLDNAVILDGALQAGGPGVTIPLALPLAGSSLDVVLYNVRIEGQVVIAEDQIVAMGGVLGGAVRKDDLVTALEALPPENLPAGLDLDTILSLLDVLVVADIDSDGDGVNDAASVGFPFTTLPGKIVDVAP